MAKLPVQFDATQVEPNAPLVIIPSDFYNATITGSEMKPTKEKGGSYCALELTIMDGEYAGRKLFDNLNLVNKNQTAVEIAYRTLSAICHAVGVFNVQDTQELHGRPLQVKVGLQAAEGDYEARNVVKGYKAIEGQAMPGAAPGFAPPWGAAQAAPAQAAPAQAAPAAAPAWQPPAAAAPAAAPVQPVKSMTAKAAGATYEQFIANGWNEEQMVAEGYLVIQYPAPAPAQAPAAGTTPPWGSAPAQAAAPTMPQPSAAATGAAPPWAK